MRKSEGSPNPEVPEPSMASPRLADSSVSGGNFLRYIQTPASSLAPHAPFMLWFSPARSLSGILAALVLLTGCSIIRAPVTKTRGLVRSVEGEVGLSRPSTNLITIQSEVMREADNYAAIVAQSCDDFAAKVGTPEAKTAALQWKLQQCTAAYTDATGENPVLNAVDMVVLASLSRKVIEDYWVGEKYGDAAKPMLQAQRELEENAWLFLNGVLPGAQQAELRKFIEQWAKANPNQRYVAAIRLREFMGILGKEGTQAAANKPNGLLNMLNVDPLSGLDPAVRAIEQTRLTAQRMLYYVQRAPLLLSWQVELTTYRVAEQPASQQLLSNAASVSQSTAIFAQTAKELPSLINTQREAAINQLFAGIAVERSNILASLESQETKLHELLPEVRQTLATGGNMANSVNGAIQSLDNFIRYVSPPDTNPPVAVSTNSKPFDVLDYGKAATQIGAMARDLQVLLVSADQNATQLARLGQQTTASAEALVDRAFARGLILILILLVGSVLAALAYRVLANKLLRQPGAPATRIPAEPAKHL